MFFKETPQLSHLQIDGQVLETVRGLVIQDSLEWNEHICMIVSKVSKRLHIMRVLSRRGVIASDLVAIYVALVRSFLEYRCVV